MSGSGCMGVAGVVSAIVWGLVVRHVLCGAGEKWRCGRSVLITIWGRSESCTFGFMFVMWSWRAAALGRMMLQI